MKNQILNMTLEELERFLNNLIKDFHYEDIYKDNIKREMFNYIQEHFKGTDVKIETSYIDYREFSISLNGNTTITIKISTKKTDELISVSKTRNMYVHKVGKFKVDRMYYSLSEPVFEKVSGDVYKVKLKDGWSEWGNELEIPDNTIPIEKLLSNSYLCKLYEEQENVSVKQEVISSATQPIYQIRDLASQQSWDKLLNVVYENNKELIDTCVENFFNK